MCVVQVFLKEIRIFLVITGQDKEKRLCNIFIVESFSGSLESVADKKNLEEFTRRLTVLLCYCCLELMIRKGTCRRENECLGVGMGCC